MCVWLHVSRSGYYSWKTRKPSPTARRRDMLEAQVRFAFEHSDGTYGYRRVHAWLARSGTAVDPETVRSVMRELGLVACQPRPWRPVTTLAGDAGDLPDLLCRDFTADAPATKLVGDITYIRTWEGWLYLATVLDCYSKKVVGHAMANHMRTELVADALRMAARTVSFRPGETIFHSDRGSEYLAAPFHACVRRLGLQQSASTRGPEDNAHVESFFHSLKAELTRGASFGSTQELRQQLRRYIAYYNRVRLHSALDYRSPIDFERHVA